MVADEFAEPAWCVRCERSHIEALPNWNSAGHADPTVAGLYEVWVDGDGGVRARLRWTPLLTTDPPEARAMIAAALADEDLERPSMAPSGPRVARRHWNLDTLQVRFYEHDAITGQCRTANCAYGLLRLAVGPSVPLGELVAVGLREIVTQPRDPAPHRR